MMRKKAKAGTKVAKAQNGTPRKTLIGRILNNKSSSDKTAVPCWCQRSAPSQQSLTGTCPPSAPHVARGRADNDADFGRAFRRGRDS